MFKKINDWFVDNHYWLDIVLAILLYLIVITIIIVNGN